MYLLEIEESRETFVPYMLPPAGPRGFIEAVPIKYYTDDGREWMRVSSS